MNIFILDRNPKLAAQYLCDSHVVKMLLETAQILCTVSYICDVKAPYKPTHIKHPCVVWAGQSLSNFDWLLEHGTEICNEYKLRYNKNHKSEAVINWCVEYAGRPDNLGLISFAQAMPNKYKCEDAVSAYRQYYIMEKSKFARWNKIPERKPYWWIF